MARIGIGSSMQNQMKNAKPMTADQIMNQHNAANKGGKLRRQNLKEVEALILDITGIKILWTRTPSTSLAKVRVT